VIIFLYNQGIPNERTDIMLDSFSRTRMLLGDGSMARLKQARIAVFGVGGVGGYCIEALARIGVGTLHIYDDDTVSTTNLNRQMIALRSTIGQKKVDVMAQRVKDINPDCRVHPISLFYCPQTADRVDVAQYDYVVDAIDTVTAKLELISRCTVLEIPIISSMGSANKLDPTAIRITDISKTDTCPLARVMRKELRKRGIYHLKVVYSVEETRTPLLPAETETAQTGSRPGKLGHKQPPGSVPFVPAAAGMALAYAVMRDLVGIS